MLEQPPNGGQFLFMYFVLQTFDGQSKKKWVGNTYDAVVSVNKINRLNIFKLFVFPLIIHVVTFMSI